jgi:reactive intermediate/imine deaminase
MAERTETPVQRRIEFRVDGLNEPISHYTDAVLLDDFLFISGCAPLDADGNLVGDTAEEQARQVFENMRVVLEAAGATFADVGRVTVYLTNIDEREQVNVVRQEVFGNTRPASTLIEVTRLALPGMRVEVEAIALVPDRNDR